jgi:hypothetical protein
MVVEGLTFSLRFPDGWSLVEPEQPVVVKGPRRERVMISSCFHEGPAEGWESEERREMMEQIAVQTMTDAASDPRLVEVTPLSRGRTLNGSPFFEMQSRSTDGATSFCQFSVVGLNSTVYVTYETPPASAGSVPIVRDVVHGLTWAPVFGVLCGRTHFREQMKYGLRGGIGVFLAALGGGVALAGLLTALSGYLAIALWTLIPGTIVLWIGLRLVLVNFEMARRLERQRVGTLPAIGAPSSSAPKARPVYSYSIDRLPPALEPYADEIRAIALPCVHLRAEPVRLPLPATASKFGGTPCMPDGATWPTGASGKPMTFVGQLNFGEIATSLSAAGQTPPPEMPESGVLSLFLDMGSMPSGSDEGDRDYRRFIWTKDPSGPVPPRAVPEQLDSPYECRLVPSVRPCLPSAGDKLAPPPVSSPNLLKAFDQLRTGILPAPRHQILGHASIVQDDPCSWTSSEPFRLRTNGDRKAWRLLWQIDTDEEDAGFMWGDMGTLYVLIREEDLRARRFDRLQVEMQCY